MTKRNEKPPHHQLAELERKAEALPISKVIKKLQGYLVGVAITGTRDEYMVVFEPRTAKGVASVLAMWQLVEQLHIRTDKENGDY